MSSVFARYPDVCGDAIVFVADDDLWLTTTDGAAPRRLTTFRARMSHPRFSPDGSKIAFTSSHNGGNDCYVVDVATGNVTRLTYHAATTLCHTTQWCDNDHPMMVSDHEMSFHGVCRVYKLDLDGTPTLMPYGIASDVALHASGAVATSTPMWREASQWKRYRGGTASKLWLKPSGTGEWQLANTATDAPCVSPTWHGDRLVFVSDRGSELPDQDQGQVWSVDSHGDDLRQHTHFDAEQGYIRDVRSDGHTIVFHAAGDLYVMADLDANSRKLDLEIPAQPHPKYPSTKDLGAFSPDHDGDGSALVWHGAAYYLTHRSGPARAIFVDDTTRVRHTAMLGETGNVIYVVDGETDDALVVASATGEGEDRRYECPGAGMIRWLAMDARGKKAATISHDGAVRVLTLETGEWSRINTVEHGDAAEPTFSPDGRYLVWVQPQKAWSAQVLLCCDLDSGLDAVQLTCGKYRDISPTFTADGKYLAFLSARTFDPMLDMYTMDLSFGSSYRPYLVPLKADQPAPFSPAADGWKISSLAKKTDAEEKEAESTEVTCEFDLANVEQRVVPLPVAAGNLSSLRAAGQGLVWLHHPDDQGSLGDRRFGVEDEGPATTVERFSFESRKHEVLVTGCSSFEISGDGAQLVYLNDGALTVVPADRKVEDSDPAKINVDMKRLRRSIRNRELWQQMMIDTHRCMKLDFWREDMDGVDWDQVLQRYLPMIDRITTHTELIDLLWEMIAELNTGHCYAFAPPGAPCPGQAAVLGAAVRRVAEGYQIEHILPGDSSHLKAVSPLLAAGVGLKSGDIIVAVDGHPVGENFSLAEALTGSADTIVELKVHTDAGERRVAVVPQATDKHVRYLNWVAQRRAYVTEHSQGRLGYLHVPDMGENGWAHFGRQIAEACEKEGLIVDVRFNGGGYISELILERISRRIVAWSLPRYGEPTPYPYQSPRGPVVLITNQFAGSDGDIVSASARSMGFDTIIGERSWGGVIGIDGRNTLVDGTFISQPRYAHWCATYNWDLENHGVDPDIEVPMTPADWNDLDEVDIQLDVAIAQTLDKLAARPATQPPTLPELRVK